jgi:hypothetical protein
MDEGVFRGWGKAVTMRRRGGVSPLEDGGETSWLSAGRKRISELWQDLSGSERSTMGGSIGSVFRVR